MTITYGSVCSGIESASVAWEPLGMTPTWFSEIEPFPCAVLKHHWPHVDNLGDMTALPDLMRRGKLVAPDILVGGTPCQAFSIAGKQLSMDDARGQLTLIYGDLLNAIDNYRWTVGKPPAISVWENVPGVLSTSDNAFGWFLGLLAGEFTLADCLSGTAKPLEAQPCASRQKWPKSGCIVGPIRTVAWRILDAQYFGVAQRRRRVFVVASARAGFDPTKVLFECEGVRRDIAPSRETKSVTSALTARGVGVSGADDNQAQARHLVVEPAQDPCVSDNLSFSLGRNNGGENVVFPAVRRLTPTECERLQGFPDGHTNIPNAADGNRYKALGNSKAVPVVQWIGKRILKELNHDY